MFVVVVDGPPFLTTSFHRDGDVRVADRLQQMHEVMADKMGDERYRRVAKILTKRFSVPDNCESGRYAKRAVRAWVLAGPVLPKLQWRTK